MFLIEEILVSEDLLKQQFTCNLTACKGACCWEGDWGAPLEDTEVETLSQIREKLRPYLTQAGNDVIDREGTHVYYEDIGKKGTPLIENSACVYLTFNETGIGQCGIEKAFREGTIDFRKPISCHLYPVRYSELEHVDFQALNYEEWSICQAACSLGASLQMPVFKFVKDALIRKFGASFYNELDRIATDLTLK